MPWPWALGSAADILVVVLRSTSLIWSGVYVGCAWTSCAAAPDTNAAAWEVPLPRKNRASMAPVGAYWASMYEPGTRRLCTCTPGATKSGSRLPSPWLENAGTTSSEVPLVPRVSFAPTAITNGSVAGSVIPPAPLLPALVTTTMPARQATSTAYASGSSVYACTESVPKDRLSTRMLTPGSCACCTTQSMPAITWDTSEVPCASATLTDTIRASGATPRKWVVSLSALVVTTPLSWPAMMPAMCVP